MQNKILLALLLAVFTLIISIGCGGGNDGITQPSSISNTEPANTNNTQTTEYGSIKIKVVWPQNGMEGSYIISSGEDENNLTANYMPYDTTKLIIEVFEKDGYPANPNLLHKTDPIERVPGWTVAEVIIEKIGRIPNL